MRHPSGTEIERIAELGRLRAPREAVGVIGPWGLKELPNIALEDDLAEISMEDLRAAVPEDTDTSDVILWHTHPGGGVGPSKTDLDARIEGVQCMVVTLDPGGGWTASRY